MHLFRPPTDRPTEEADNISSECGQFSRVIAELYIHAMGTGVGKGDENEERDGAAVQRSFQ